MVSGNPPRHSKTPDEPVTIDLEAEETLHDARTEAMMRPDGSEPGSSSADEVEVPLDAESEPPVERQDAASSGTAKDNGPDDKISADSSTGVSQGQARISSLVAAGIVGGLIALVGAGAMDYAGLLPGRSTPRDGTADIAALTAEIDGLRQTVANLAATPPASADAALENRIAALEAASATAGANGGTADIATTDASNRKIADLSAQIDQMKASLTQATQDQASTGADISKRLDDAEKKLNEPREDTAVARAIAAAALKAAIDRGGPFRPELDTFAGIAPDDPAVADLRNFAEIGVPSRADLIRQVPDVANAIIDATQQPDPSQSWSDRLVASAKTLVKVRPLGNIEGDGVDAVAARFEDKIKNGDLPGAITEWNNLPDAAKSASAAFRQSIDARIRVEDLVGEALSKAIAGAGKQS